MGSPLGPLMTNALMPPWGIASFGAFFGCHATLPGALRDIQKNGCEEDYMGYCGSGFPVCELLWCKKSAKEAIRDTCYVKLFF